MIKKYIYQIINTFVVGADYEQDNVKGGNEFFFF